MRLSALAILACLATACFADVIVPGLKEQTQLCGACCDGESFCGKVSLGGSAFPANTAMTCYKSESGPGQCVPTHIDDGKKIFSTLDFTSIQTEPLRPFDAQNNLKLDYCQQYLADGKALVDETTSCDLQVQNQVCGECCNGFFTCADNMQCLAKDLSADPAAGMGGRCVPKVLSAAKGANYCKSLLPRSAKGQALKADKPLSCTSCGSCTFNSWAKKVKGAVVFGQASGNVACLSQCVSYGADGKCAAYSSCSSTGIASGPAGSTVQTGSVTTQVQTQGDAGGNALGAIGQNNGASVQGGALIGSNVPSGFFNMFNQATPAPTPVPSHTPAPAQWG